MTDMADIKTATNSSNTGNKFVDRFNVGDLGVVKEIEGDFYSVEWESDRQCYRYTIDELEVIGM